MGDNLNGNRNTYHLVLVIKYRGVLISEEFFDSLMAIFMKIALEHGIVVRQVNWEFDHIHVLFEAEPGTDLDEFVKSYQTISSEIMKKHYPIIKGRLWIRDFWQGNYFIATTDEADIEDIRRYIETQREKRPYYKDFGI